MATVSREATRDAPLPVARPRRGAWRQFWRAFARNRLAVGGGVVVLGLALVAISAPARARWAATRRAARRILVGPSGNHWLGTDQLGRDVLSRVVHGARVSLAVGFVSVGIMAMVGIIMGALAGYYGGMV